MLGTASTVVAKVFALLGQGGPFMFVLLVLSIVALTIIVVKLWQFRNRRVGRRKFIGPVLQTWQSRDRSAAIEMISRERGPVARVMHAAMHGSARMQIDRETLGDEVQRIAREQLAAIDSGMRGLELVAFLAPLFGFFGTVLALLGIGAASGLDAALISTATGLTISIIVSIFYYLFDRRIERERGTMESALGQILSAPARAAPPARRETGRRGAKEPEYEEEEYEEYEEYEDDEGYYEPEFR